MLGAASGMVAGLTTITPASGFVSIPAAILIGSAAGSTCYFAVTRLKARFGYDDSLDVFGVHGVGSMLGMLMLGFLANVQVNEQIGRTCMIDGQLISLAGGGVQFFNQLNGVCFTVAFAGAATWLLLKAVDNLVGLRVTEEEENLGLDLSQHGESAYND
ncbi:MAG TPA: hypothetical protein VNZ64_01905 [Candidatus Acidoferrum sp.]|nr:hypothetical protein [Candidatus Acidoferrum sp.]